MTFRTRLFLMTALLVVAVLTIAVALGWSRILAFEVDRLDDRLCMEAKRLAFPPADEPQRGLEADLLGKLRLASVDQLLFHIESGPGLAVRESANWQAIAPGSVKWSVAPSPPARLDQAPPRAEPQVDFCELGEFDGGERQWRAARFTLPAGRSIVAVDLAATRGELHGALRSALFWVTPVALALIALGAWGLASLTVQPINRLREAMKRVNRNALDERLSDQDADREFAELIAAYNTMLARLEASFLQASRFSADAAHELKTPLTILQGRLEQALNAGEQHTLDLTSMLDEVGRLSAITRKLLLLSQADAGRLAVHPESLDLSDLLHELMADAQMLLQGQRLTCDIAPDLAVAGDALLLRQLFNNLMSNAIRYCVPAGWITISARQTPDQLEIRFANACEPVPTTMRQRFFDRFFRGDAAHSSRIEGSGLGLSLAREIARAHGGELVLEDTAADVVSLCLRLPKIAK